MADDGDEEMVDVQSPNVPVAPISAVDVTPTPIVGARSDADDVVASEPGGFFRTKGTIEDESGSVPPSFATLTDVMTSFGEEHRLGLMLACGGLLAAGVVLLLVLTPLSFRSVDFDEVGLKYDRLTREIDDTEQLFTGRHHVGPSGTILTFETTQRIAEVANLSTLTSDGLDVSLTVTVTHTINTTLTALLLMQELYGTQEAYDVFVRDRVETTVRIVAVTFSTRQFFLERQLFQASLTDALGRVFNDTSSMFSVLNLVQVINVDLPHSVEAVLTAVTTSRQDIENAGAERPLRVREAEIRVTIATVEASLRVLRARRDVAAVGLRRLQDVSATIVRYTERATVWANASAALGLSGDDVVSAYLLPQAVTSGVQATVQF